jgi:hypothetical protein
MPCEASSALQVGFAVTRLAAMKFNQMAIDNRDPLFTVGLRVQCLWSAMFLVDSFQAHRTTRRGQCALTLSQIYVQAKLCCRMPWRCQLSDRGPSFATRSSFIREGFWNPWLPMGTHGYPRVPKGTNR